VICLRAIITSRGRPLPVSSQHVGLKRERVIQRFPKSRYHGFACAWHPECTNRTPMKKLDGLRTMLTERFGRWRALLVGLVLALAIGGPFVYSAVELARFERADARRATFIYAAGQSLAPGIYVQRIGLAATLSRLGYAETRAIPASPGQFRRVGSDWELVPRGIEERGSKAGLVRLHVVDERIQRVT